MINLEPASSLRADYFKLQEKLLTVMQNCEADEPVLEQRYWADILEVELV